MKLTLVKFCKVALVFLLILSGVHSHCVFAQTAQPRNYLIEKNNVDSSTSFILKASPSEIQRLKKNGAIKFFRKISNENYIVALGELFSKENISIVKNVSNKWKLSGKIENKIRFPSQMVIEVVNLEGFCTHALRNKLSIRTADPRTSTAIILIENESQFADLVEDDNVVFIKPSATPRDESPNTLQDLSVNRINLVHDRVPQLNGEGLTVSIKERAIDTTDIDLKNRFVRTSLADTIISLHANQIATIIAGGGNSIMSAKGIAWRSEILSSSYENLLPDDMDVLQSNNAWLQNHSYGTSIESFYGPEARAYDILAVSDPYNINVFSSGNSGTSTSTEGQYQNIAGYSNLTGNMKMAKNVIVAGGHQQFYELDERNSNGPAFDGRVKPELVAFGPEGTSDAAAFVSGTVALIQQHYRTKNGILPRIDMVKAVLIASADDIGPKGLDHKSGFGALNANSAIEIVDASNHQSAEVSALGSTQIQLDIPSGIQTAKVCLNWIDPPVASGSSEALLNDLDMSITTPEGAIVRPWVLSHFPNADSLALPAKRKEDHLNNIEYITLEQPVAGIYTINIYGKEIFEGAQKFSIAYHFEKENDFMFTYPTSSDRVNPDDMVIRWKSTFEGMGTLSASTDDGQTYVSLSDVDLANGYYALVPGFRGRVLLKMEIGGESFVSESFIVSIEPGIEVEYVCDESAMIAWEKIDNANSYNIYTMGAQYLELVKSVTDTVAILDRAELPSNYFAVEPVIDGSAGYRSASYDITAQGVNCYYKGLNAVVENGNGTLTLILSTTFNVDRIIWQKKILDEFQAIGETPVSGVSEIISFADEDLLSGVTVYRAIIVLKSQETVQTNDAVIYYADEISFVLFPNPVDLLTQDLAVLTDGDGLGIYFYDRTGKLVKTQEILNPLFYFSVADLDPGLYLYRIQRGTRWVSSGKILLR